MTNRREFLRTGVTVSAMPLAINGLLSAETAAREAGAGGVALHATIVDDRYAEARRFGDALGELGVRAAALRDGDVTDAYLALRSLWRERPAAIAGLTQFGPMFVLERLGFERGLRVVLRVEHRVRGDGELEHAIAGAPHVVALAETLQRQGVEWPVLFAALARTASGGGLGPRVERTVRTPGAKPELSRGEDPLDAFGVPESVIHYYRPIALRHGFGIPWDGPLFSWVIAPKAQG
ncbi:MAG TPA: hypothetical protein VIN61_05715 [Gammaproteobacteria bacterium]